MATEGLSPERISVVLVRAANLLCALPLASVIETLRCPPLVAISGTPECVIGLAMIHGTTVAVVDLGILLGAAAGHAITEARLLALRAGDRIVGLAVSSVIGVRGFDRAAFAAVPSMLGQAHPEVLTAVGSLDRELLLLDGSRIMTEEIMGRLEA